MNTNYKLALVFPGQGAQVIGMGLDVLSRHPELNNILEIAQAQTGAPLKEIIQSGDARLHETIYTQPALLLAEILLFEDIKKSFKLEPSALCGFSLGEYTALYAGGVLGVQEVFRLINQRAQLMNRAALEQPGAMAAILGLNHEFVSQACREASSVDDIVVPANYNSPGQVVISGHNEAIERAIINCQRLGARRAMKLAVSGAFHSPLMNQASIQFKEVLNGADLNKPNTVIYLNTTAKPLYFDEIRQQMAKQIVSPVLFEQTVCALKEAGITHVIEIGPGTVLAGLIRKCAPEINVFSYQKTSDIDALKGWLNLHELIG